ncbi:MAG: cbb3-type cytochrome c oxidase subunit 3 [Pseudomonadota bacterium]|nr:cbb3-type cytochrome c oxidase subunit 3 [Pseudomonadota bacterium]
MRVSFLAADAQAAAQSWMGAGLTTSFLLFFLGWVLWAYWPSNRARMESHARIPFDGDE